MVNFSRLAKSFRHAWRGLVHTIFFHQNLRIHFAIAAVAATLGILLKITPLEWVAILMAIFLVLVAEMVNTSIEEIINLVREDHHERARIAKDVSAGMVLMATIFAVIVGLVILLPRLL